MTETFNDADRKVMILAAEHYHPDIPALENEAYVTMIRDAQEEWQTELAAQMRAIMAEGKVGKATPAEAVEGTTNPVEQS